MPLVQDSVVRNTSIVARQMVHLTGELSVYANRFAQLQIFLQPPISPNGSNNCIPHMLTCEFTLLIQFCCVLIWWDINN